MAHDKWHLPESEVHCSGGGSTRTHRKKLTHASRAIDERSWRLKLVHAPTGVEVEGEVPMGNYSKKQMQEARERVYQELYRELEKRVAKHLRLPGW